MTNARKVSLMVRKVSVTKNVQGTENSRRVSLNFLIRKSQMLYRIFLCVCDNVKLFHIFLSLLPSGRIWEILASLILVECVS